MARNMLSGNVTQQPLTLVPQLRGGDGFRPDDKLLQYMQSYEVLSAAGQDGKPPSYEVLSAAGQEPRVAWSTTDCGAVV